MIRLSAIVLLPALMFGFAARLSADTVQLVNGDRLHGRVTSLDDKQLTIHSESFGDVKIPRAKVDVIALGDKPLPDARQMAGAQPSAVPQSNLLGQIAPLLQNSTAQQELGPMIEKLLGAGGVGDLQKNMDEARRGLQDLKKDLGNGPESQGLDGYINLFNLFGQLSPQTPATPKAASPSTARPDAPKKAESAKKTTP